MFPPLAAVLHSTYNLGFNLHLSISSLFTGFDNTAFLTSLLKNPVDVNGNEAIVSSLSKWSIASHNPLTSQ